MALERLKNGPRPTGHWQSRGGWNTRIHLVAADTRTAMAFSLPPGNDHDALAGRALIGELGEMSDGLPMFMDFAYEGDETRQLFSTWHHSGGSA
jgi:hypothetical protein